MNNGAVNKRQRSCSHKSRYYNKLTTLSILNTQT